MNNFFYIKSVSSLFQQKILWSHLKVNSWPGARLHHPCSPPLLSLCQRHLQPPGSKYQNINFTQTKAFKSLRLSKIEILKWKHWYSNVWDWQSSNTKCLTYNIGISCNMFEKLIKLKYKSHIMFGTACKTRDNRVPVLRHQVTPVKLNKL